MVDLSPRLSIACLYNLKAGQPKRIQDESYMEVSPVSTLRSPQVFVNNEKHVVVSPVEKTGAAYFPDDKICMPVEDGIQVQQTAHPLSAPPKYPDSELPERVHIPPPFWRRHLLWIMAALITLIILIGILIGLVTVNHHKEGNTQSSKVVVTNNTMNSVASSGLFMRDGTTWNMHLFAQNKTGGITLQVCLDGSKYEPLQYVDLAIKPKVGSPLSATAELDSQTGVVMINLFYISGDHNVTMSAITCPEASADCMTVSNCLLPTTFPVHNNTGLSAVNVNDAQDWRVYYYDNQDFISQLQGSASGFNLGERIGGQALNASSIATVNINSTSNNIRLFYVDKTSQNLYNMQFADGAWTTPLPLDASRFAEWNPNSGLGAAYSVVPDTLHVYFTGLDTGIYEYIGSNASTEASTSWSTDPSRQKIWANADYIGADITAAGWKDQVRFYQVSAGKIAQGRLNNQTWSENFVN